MSPPASRNRGKRKDRVSEQSDTESTAEHGDSGAAEPSWIWGRHAAQAALSNRRRRLARVCATANAARDLFLPPDAPDTEIMTGRHLARLLPHGAVHQGIAVLAEPLETPDLAALIAARPERIAVLDQVTDPGNAGAVLRSASAFGFGAFIQQTRNAPEPGGVLAKAAAGALETVPMLAVVNIARTLNALADAGYAVVGLAGEAEETLGDVLAKAREAPAQPVALVLGAEGAGLRKGVAAACTALARIPIDPAMESLNISAAAAIAFHEAARLS